MVHTSTFVFSAYRVTNLRKLQFRIESVHVSGVQGVRTFSFIDFPFLTSDNNQIIRIFQLKNEYV